MFKVKVYRVYPKDKPELWYLVDAPSKRVAKWCGAAILNNTYFSFLSSKDVIANRWKFKED